MTKMRRFLKDNPFILLLPIFIFSFSKSISAVTVTKNGTEYYEANGDVTNDSPSSGWVRLYDPFGTYSYANWKFTGLPPSGSLKIKVTYKCTQVGNGSDVYAWDWTINNWSGSLAILTSSSETTWSKDVSPNTYISSGGEVRLRVRTGESNIICVKSVAVEYTPHVINGTPNKPSGPTTLLVNQEGEYTTGGCTCSLGHSVGYKFWWDDGSSTYHTSLPAKHKWTNPGNYDITAQAICTSDGNIKSSESAALTVGVVPSYTLLGTVKNADMNVFDQYEPLQGVTVSINTSPTKSTVTDGGNYSISGIPSGTYTITGSKTGFYRPQSHSRTITSNTTDDFKISSDVTISSTSLSKTNPSSGETITITYKLNNVGSSSETVYLGASHRKNGTSDWIDDQYKDVSGHDKPVSVPVGSNYPCTRLYTIPSNSPDGSYDLVTAIWETKSGDGYMYRRLYDKLETNKFTVSFNFSLSANPTSGSVQQGQSATTTVTATLTSGSTKPVTLSASGLPSGANPSFSSNPISPTASSTMTISTSSSTPTGTYPITVTGTGGGVTRTTSFTLTMTLDTYRINIVPLWDSTTEILKISASVFNQSKGEKVTTGSGSYEITKDSQVLQNGSLTYSSATTNWESGNINFFYTGTFTARVTVNGNPAQTTFTTEKKRATISGLVKDKEGNTVSGATVQLYLAKDLNIPLEEVFSTESGYAFVPVCYESYKIIASKDSKSGTTGAFYVNQEMVVKNIVISADLIGKYSGQIERITNNLQSLIDMNGVFLSYMSQNIDKDITEESKIETTLEQIDTWTGVMDVCTGLYRSSKIAKESEKVTETMLKEGTKELIKEVINTDTMPVECKNDCVEGTEVYPELAGLFYSVDDKYREEVLLGDYPEFDTYFLSKSYGGKEFGVGTSGIGNHYFPIEKLNDKESVFGPYKAQKDKLNFNRTALMNFFADTTSFPLELDLEKVSEYLQERTNDLSFSLSPENALTQNILYLPEIEKVASSVLKPVWFRYIKDEMDLQSLLVGKCVTLGISIAGNVAGIFGHIGFAADLALTAATTASSAAIDRMEHHLESDLLMLWCASRGIYERDLIDYSNYLNFVHQFLTNEFRNPNYLRKGNEFSGEITDVDVSYVDLISEIEVNAIIKNTGAKADLTLSTENYVSVPMASVFPFLELYLPLLNIFPQPNFMVLSGGEPVVFKDIDTDGICGVVGQRFFVDTGFLSKVLDRHKLWLKLYCGPWRQKDKVVSYNPFCITYTVQPKLRNNILGGIRTKAKHLTLQDATELVVREKEQHVITVTSDADYEQDITASTDAKRLLVYLYHSDGDANLHLYQDSAHIGFNSDAGSSEIQFSGTYSGPQSNPELITIEDAAGNIYHIKVDLVQPSGAGNVTGTLLIMEEPIRPAVMATSPITIETDGIPGVQGLGVNVKIGEASIQHPLNNLKISLSALANKYAQSLSFSSSTTYEKETLPAGGEEALTFSVDIPDDATAIYTGTMTISTTNAGEIVKDVVVRVDSDEEGIPDYWEKLYELDPLLADSNGNGITDADEDSDGDRYTNLQEYRAGSSPLDKDSMPLMPLSPSNLEAVATSSSQIMLTWLDNSTNPGEEGFRIERKIEGSTYSEIDSVGVNETTYYDESLSPATTYFYQLKAYNSAGDSEYSNEVSVKTLDVPTPPPPPPEDDEGGGGGGCFIATAAFGSPLAKEVEILRKFRDKYLLTNNSGRRFVGWYYRKGPIGARFISAHLWAKHLTRITLYPVIAFAYLLIKGLLTPIILLVLATAVGREGRC